MCRTDARYGSLRSERNHPSTGGGWVSVDEGVQTGTCRWSELPSRRSGNFKRPHLANPGAAGSLGATSKLPLASSKLSASPAPSSCDTATCGPARNEAVNCHVSGWSGVNRYTFLQGQGCNLDPLQRECPLSRCVPSRSARRSAISGRAPIRFSCSAGSFRIL